MPDEIWKKIERFPWHEVSNHGRLRSWLNRGAGRRELQSPRIIKGSIASHGYRQSTLLSKDGVMRGVLIHRLVAEAFHDLRPFRRGEKVDHINGDRLDNRACNLRVVTQSENLRNRTGLFELCFQRKKRPWRVDLRLDGTRVSVGNFRCYGAAFKAYRAVRLAHDPVSYRYALNRELAAGTASQ